jgi:allantoinase
MTAAGREYIGYGANPPRVQWPGGARLALSLVLNYEEGSERTRPTDGENETLGELSRDVGRDHRDLATESVYQYGSRAGVYRLLRLVDKYGVRCTCFAAAIALERNPEVAAWLRESGHEPCAHGWRWTEDWRLSREEQKERIHLAVTSLEQSCGERPVGWYSRWMPSMHTRELLVEEGGFLYDSDAYNDDLPYSTEVDGKSHLVIPYTLTYNDARFVSGGVGGPSDFLDYCVRAIDFLREEGDLAPKMLSIGLHARISGQAGRASTIRDLLEHVLATGDVWVATRRQIAEWWLEHQTAEA